MLDIEEREINLKHLFFTLCKKWKQIIICAIIGAIILGAYGYYEVKPTTNEIDSKELAQKQIELEREQDYLNNSIFLKYSSKKIHQRTLQIDIVLKNENSNYIMDVFESYANAVQSKELFNSLAEALGEENSNYMYELVSISTMNNNGDVYTLRDDIHGNIILSFRIILSGLDGTYTEKIAAEIKQYIEKQVTAVNLAICPHNVNIFNILSKNIDYKSNKEQVEKNIKKLS